MYPTVSHIGQVTFCGRDFVRWREAGIASLPGRGFDFERIAAVIDRRSGGCSRRTWRIEIEIVAEQIVFTQRFAFFRLRRTRCAPCGGSRRGCGLGRFIRSRRLAGRSRRLRGGARSGFRLGSSGRTRRCGRRREGFAVARVGFAAAPAFIGCATERADFSVVVEDGLVAGGTGREIHSVPHPR